MILVITSRFKGVLKMLNLKEKINLVTRILTFLSCFVFCILMVLHSDYVKHLAIENIIPLLSNNETSQVQSDTAPSAVVDTTNVDIINNEFDNIFNSNQDISSIVLYKFVSPSGSKLYNGQMIIASKNKNKPIENNGNIESIHDNSDMIQELLLNKIRYDNISTIKTLCKTKYDQEKNFSCAKFQQLGTSFKSVVSIPMVDKKSLAVIGYIMITLDSDYNNLEIENIVNNLDKNIENIQKQIK